MELERAYGNSDNDRRRIWGRVQTKLCRLPQDLFRFDDELCGSVSNVFESIHLLYKNIRNDKITCTESLRL